MDVAHEVEQPAIRERLPLLGYDVVDTKLVINKDEAERVRQIFALYVELRALIPTAQELARRGCAG